MYITLNTRDVYHKITSLLKNNKPNIFIEQLEANKPYFDRGLLHMITDFRRSIFFRINRISFQGKKYILGIYLTAVLYYNKYYLVMIYNNFHASI